MPAWVKCKGIGNEEIYVNMSHASTMFWSEIQKSTTINLIDDIKVPVRETPEELIKAAETQRAPRR